MNNNSKNPNQYFFENSHSITENQLLEHNLKYPSEGLIRFFNRMENFVFGVQAFDDDHSVHLFYADFKNEFRAVGIVIPIDYKLDNELVLVFAREIVILNNDLDIFDVYNTLQHKRETALELLGYLTYDPKEIRNGTIYTIGQTIKPVLKLDRVDFMKNMFKDIVNNEKLDPKNKIYIMIDDDSGYIKIGKSINPKYREGTLQSKKPGTYLLAYWTAPAQIEKNLHQKYASKRKRGEWFHLTIDELEEIKSFMNSLN